MTTLPDEVVRAVVTEALGELDAEHQPDPELKGRGGCLICWPKDGSWPCTTRLITNELRAGLEDVARAAVTGALRTLHESHAAVEAVAHAVCQCDDPSHKYSSARAGLAALARLADDASPSWQSTP